jgi:hypothetical protein
MTENNARDIDTFARQALISGEKVPVLWGLMNNVAKKFNMKLDVDVGMKGKKI